ncbi:MarR family transcriptional regulator [Frankia sp. B2]|uniref:MarR family winged helix-turn-helix transcriptional regulator n=1 Tax=Frankia sp. B2 TaxID=2541730 RepID=UPI00106B8FAA|nr:MarR family winged helix-turn-helix transcriptional regulator [Frankia sp. B2]TFE24038.1 MarR family transcriptional regulator [Frankia sp. B2]
MDAHTSKALRLSDPQRRALRVVRKGSVSYRADSVGHGYFSARGASEITLNARTIDSLVRQGLIVEVPDQFRDLRGGLVRIRPYRLTDAGRTALGLVHEAPQADAPATVDVADVRVGMATPLGWVDYISPLDHGGAIVYYRPFDRSALTCRAWPRGERLTLVPCPHVPSYFDRSHCAKCGHELGSVAA